MPPTSASRFGACVCGAAIKTASTIHAQAQVHSFRVDSPTRARTFLKRIPEPPLNLPRIAGRRPRQETRRDEVGGDVRVEVDVVGQVVALAEEIDALAAGHAVFF